MILVAAESFLNMPNLAITLTVLGQGSPKTLSRKIKSIILNTHSPRKDDICVKKYLSPAFCSSPEDGAV